MIYILTGPNDFMIKQTLDSLLHDFTQKYGHAGIEKYSGEELEASRLPSILQGGSLFSSHRLIVFRDVAKQKDIWNALEGLLESIPEEILLIIIEPQLDKRTKTYKALQKVGDFRECALLDERGASTWLQQLATQQSVSLDARLAAYLVAKVGPDQWQLSQEFSKLALGDITKARIDELVAPNPQASAFDLLDAALQGDMKKTAAIVAALQLSEDPYRLFGLVVSQAQTLAIVASADGKSADTIAREAGVHPFAVKKTMQQSKNSSKARVRSIIAELAVLDDRLKSIGADPWLLIRQALMTIASTKK